MSRYFFFLVHGLTVCCALAGTGWPALAEDPWADAVVAHVAIQPATGFDTPEKAVGEPSGGGVITPNNSSLHSIGRPGSYLTLQFNTPVTDDPANPMGLDCIVFSNVVWVGGVPTQKWVEPGLIEISEDVNANGAADDPWYVIPGSRGLAQSIGPVGMANPTPKLAGNVSNPNGSQSEYDWGYAELTPTQKKYLDNYVRPDDPFEVGLTPRSGGGDAFDIAWAVDENGAAAGLTQFHFIRIWALIDAVDATFGYITPEIDAVADVAPAVDSDGDGILDEYETRVAGTDPVRAENAVLPLEIPVQDGGSPAGTELGSAGDAAGNGITLYSDGLRTGMRAYNCIVDIGVPGADPGGAVPGLTKSAVLVEFESSEADFEAAQVQSAELTVAYAGAAIAGLDEIGLQPYRFDGVAYTQDGIANVQRDLDANHVQFRSRYAGIFVLASTAGAGDTGGASGVFALRASPLAGVAADPVNKATITSGVIRGADENPVGDGTLFTVSTTLGSILAGDADAGTSGVQVAADSGVITFDLAASTQAGTALVEAVSLDGTRSGSLAYPFLAGPPHGSVAIDLLTPDAVAPGPIAFSAGVLADQYGNVLDGGTVTLVVDGGYPVSADADAGTSGHQVAVHEGMAVFWVRADTAGDFAVVTIGLYADSGLTELLGEGSFGFEVVEMPLRMASVLAVLLLAAYVWRCRPRSQRSGTKGGARW